MTFLTEDMIVYSSRDVFRTRMQGRMKNQYKGVQNYSPAGDKRVYHYVHENRRNFA